MDDYIKRSDAIKTVCGDCEYYSTNDCEDCRLDRLTKIPAADVRTVKKGEWITPPKNRDYSHLVDFYECPFCGYIEDCFVNFCPNCGANMKEEKQ